MDLDQLYITFLGTIIILALYWLNILCAFASAIAKKPVTPSILMHFVWPACWLIIAHFVCVCLDWSPF